MADIRKCPKCNGDMKIGYVSNAWRWTEGKSLWGMPRSKAYAHACQNCGFIEFYLEQKANERKNSGKLVRIKAKVVSCALDQEPKHAVSGQARGPQA